MALTAVGCGSGPTALPARIGNVAGRGLQPPWWTALPPVLASADSPTEEQPLQIPADALFDTGSAEVRRADVARLEAFAGELADRVADSNGVWWLVGGTDSTGDNNDALGRARAESIARIITATASIEPDRLHTGSWGEDCPAVAEADSPDLAQARAANRRVVIVPPGVEPQCPIH